MLNYTESFAYRFSGDIRLAREDMKLTQATVAELMGVDCRTYVRYENGTRIPRADVFLRLVFFFDLDIKQYQKGVISDDLVLTR